MGNVQGCEAPPSIVVTNRVIPETTIHKIVDDVVHDSFRLHATKMPNKRDVLVRAGAHLTKAQTVRNRALDGVATDFVVKYFFQTDDALFHFFQIVTTTFESALKVYREHRGLKENQLVFLYKGGNVMRILGREFLLQLPATATKAVDEFFGKFFRRSDADFAIYLDTNIDPKRFDQLHDELTVVSYRLQEELRDVFLKDLELSFSFFRNSASWQRRLLAPIVRQLNDAEDGVVARLREEEEEKQSQEKEGEVKKGEGKSEDKREMSERDLQEKWDTQEVLKRDPIEDIAIGHGPSGFGCFPIVSRPHRKPDTTMEFYDKMEDFRKPERWAAQAPLVPEVGSKVGGNDILTITHNDTLDFANRKVGRETGQNVRRIQFNLTRTKVNIAVRRRSNAAQMVMGELIDVSIGTRNDDAVREFWQDMEKHTALYTLRSSDGGEVTFRGYSLENIIDDLLVVLFINAEAPWEDAKFLKRINRLSFLTFMEIFLKIDSSAEKLRLLKLLSNDIYKPIADGTFSTASSGASVKAATAQVAPRTLPGTASFLKHLDLSASKFAQRDEMKQIGQTLRDNTTFLIRTIQSLASFCTEGGAHVREKDVYEAEVSALS